MFSTSLGLGAGGAAGPHVENLRQLRLRRGPQTQCEHVGIVPRAPRPPSARQRTAPRGCPAPCWRRSTPPSSSSTRRSPARLGRRPRRGPPLRSPMPSRGRSASAYAPCRSGSCRRRRSSSGSAGATPVSSSAASAMRIGRGSAPPAPGDVRTRGDRGFAILIQRGLNGRLAVLERPSLETFSIAVLDQRHQRAALVGQRVLDPRRHLWERLTFDDPLLLERAQAQRQRPRTDAVKRALELAGNASGPPRGRG